MCGRWVPPFHLAPLATGNSGCGRARATPRRSARFGRHANAVYNHLFRRVADWSEAEDLTSAVFLQAWRTRGRVVIDRESALPWLLGVANHVLRNHRRASRRYRDALRRIVPAEEAAGDHADAVAAACP